MKKIALLIGFLFLAGCQSKPELIRTKYHVVVPPKAMFTCPIPRQFPDHRTLNDLEVAKTLVTLYKNNRVCRNSVDALERFLNEAKAKIEEDKYEK
jgi:hypothetical protein